jgi:hypothetical protein
MIVMRVEWRGQWFCVIWWRSIQVPSRDDIEAFLHIPRVAYGVPGIDLGLLIITVLITIKD